MAQPILMPTLGQTVEESTLVRWLKQEGDTVAPGDVLFEVETDKAVLEAESFVEGTLLKILVKDGETVPVQSTVAFVGEPGNQATGVALWRALPATRRVLRGRIGRRRPGWWPIAGRRRIHGRWRVGRHVCPSRRGLRQRLLRRSRVAQWRARVHHASNAGTGRHSLLCCGTMSVPQRPSRRVPR